MTLPLVTRRAARSEFDDAVDWYERRRRGLGVRFARAVRSRLDLIAADPLRFPIVDLDIREANVPRFPFAIYYVVEPTVILVLSVFHTSRDPNVWKQRR